MSEAIFRGPGRIASGAGVPTVHRFIPGALANGTAPRCILEPLPEDWEPRTVDEVVQPYRRDLLDYEHIDDYAPELCDEHHLPGACGVELGHGDAGRARRVDPRGGVRRGWLGRLVRICLPRLAGNQRHELVGQRRDDGRERGRADCGGRTNSDGPTGSERVLRELVGE